MDGVHTLPGKDHFKFNLTFALLLTIHKNGNRQINKEWMEVSGKGLIYERELNTGKLILCLTP